jgi:hypothetical protein
MYIYKENGLIVLKEKYNILFQQLRFNCNFLREKYKKAHQTTSRLQYSPPMFKK